MLCASELKVMKIPDGWNENAPLAMATKLCVGPNRSKVRFILREEPNDTTDSGWVFFSGLEPEGYNELAENFVICPLLSFVEIEPDLIDLLDSPVGSMYERPRDDQGWQKVVDHDPHQ